MTRRGTGVMTAQPRAATPGRLGRAALAAPAGTLGLLATGLTSAPKQLLTASLPAAPAATYLVAVGTLVWWAAALAAEAVVRGRVSLWPALPPGLVLVAGIASGVPRGSASQLW